MDTILGIDLGTTNCSVTAIGDDGRTMVVKNSLGEYITPSAVYFCEKKNEFIVGKNAKEKSNSDPANLVLFVKREMGKDKTTYKNFENTKSLFFQEIEICSHLVGMT